MIAKPLARGESDVFIVDHALLKLTLVFFILNSISKLLQLTHVKELIELGSFIHPSGDLEAVLVKEDAIDRPNDNIEATPAVTFP